MLVFAMGACRIVPPTNPPVDSDAGPTPSDAALEVSDPTLSGCGRAWQRIAALHCSVTVPRTGTWTESCENAEENGVDMRTSCVTAAQTCEAVRACLGER